MSTSSPTDVARAVAPEAVSGSLRHVEVVAGVIRDARGRVLLARRTEGRDLAGLWEFPGGKHEPGESAEGALARELHEELGIDVDIGAPLINVPQRYPDKRLRLDVRSIAAWRGHARGLEGQALVWVPPQKLGSYAMPPADRPVVAALLQPAHYLVTPPPQEGDAGWLARLERALANGVRRVQLRAPGLDTQRWHSLASQAAALCRHAGADVLVNGDSALALELGIGLHLPARMLHGLSERPVPPGVSLAASCHDVDDLLAAEALACDFAVLGTLKPTPSHPGVEGIGWGGFAGMRERVSLPIYAIGGLGPGDVDEARAHGAQGIAAIRGLWPST
ncbi:Nudix family hydrolase [Lysobacter auxotrophicus]|uniref:8-oxo-dGTP diphosphatase n=1 Tax=Lysobacter auxotrophicus TaxID=2992573 RepID=A0ABM8DAH9_9GAMM|nr:Nudix family hydrolase [Lysobacter auxotrophicus]BDU15554.1 Nudix family hydrolase [Lysobacter auxotrophicus]